MSGSLYDRLEAALDMIARNQADQPDLGAIAAVAGMSPHHFQRTFRRWVGISPKRFLQYLTLDRAKGEPLRQRQPAGCGAGRRSFRAGAPA